MASLLRVVHLVENLVHVCQLEVFDRRKELANALVHLLVQRLEILRRLLRCLLRLSRRCGCLSCASRRPHLLLLVAIGSLLCLGLLAVCHARLAIHPSRLLLLNALRVRRRLTVLLAALLVSIPHRRLAMLDRLFSLLRRLTTSNVVLFGHRSMGLILLFRMLFFVRIGINGLSFVCLRLLANAHLVADAVILIHARNRLVFSLWSIRLGSLSFARLLPILDGPVHVLTLLIALSAQLFVELALNRLLQHFLRQLLAVDVGPLVDLREQLSSHVRWRVLLQVVFERHVARALNIYLHLDGLFKVLRHARAAHVLLSRRLAIDILLHLGLSVLIWIVIFGAVLKLLLFFVFLLDLRSRHGFPVVAIIETLRLLALRLAGRCVLLQAALLAIYRSCLVIRSFLRQVRAYYAVFLEQCEVALVSFLIGFVRRFFSAFLRGRGGRCHLFVAILVLVTVDSLSSLRLTISSLTLLLDLPFFVIYLWKLLRRLFNLGSVAAVLNVCHQSIGGE